MAYEDQLEELEMLKLEKRRFKSHIIVISKYLKGSQVEKGTDLFYLSPTGHS